MVRDAGQQYAQRQFTDPPSEGYVSRLARETGRGNGRQVGNHQKGAPVRAWTWITFVAARQAEHEYARGEWSVRESDACMSSRRLFLRAKVKRERERTWGITKDNPRLHESSLRLER